MNLLELRKMQVLLQNLWNGELKEKRHSKTTLSHAR